MKILCKTHGIVEGRFVDHDLACVECLDLSYANTDEGRVATVTRRDDPAQRFEAWRNILSGDPDIVGMED
jgi:hypothetical protein